MKKILVVTLLILATCLTLVSCNFGKNPTNQRPDGNDSGNETSGTGTEDVVKPPKVMYNIPEGGYDGSEVTITFSHTMNQTYQDVLDMYIQKFNEIYPNITVEHQQVGGYDEVRDQIKTELAAGNQPNIAYCYPDHVALYNVTKKVVPLDAFIDSKIEDKIGGGILGLTDEQKADFIPGYYAEGAVFDAAGTMYTLPMSKSTEVIYYDKTFFEEHDLEIPTTWEEMKALCIKIKEIDPNCIPLGYDSEANWFITMCEQYHSPYTSNTGDKYPFVNDTNKAFVKEFSEWYQAGYVTTKELHGAYTSTLFVSTDKVRSYMSIGSTGGAKNQVPTAVDGKQPFEVGIAPLPQIDPEDPKAISQGPSLCIFDQTNKQEVIASWLFVKFLTTDPEFQAVFSMTSGYMPVIKSAAEIPVYKTWAESANGNSTKGVIALAAKVGLEMADSYFVSPAFNGSSLARDKVGLLMQYCFVNIEGKTGADVDAVINQAFFDAKKACIEND